MFRPQRVYLDPKDTSALTFDLFTDIEPIKETAPMPAPVLNLEAEAMNASIGTTFNVDVYLNNNYNHKRTQTKAKAVLHYLTSNVDPSIVRFGTNGGIYYKNVLVPETDLANVLENLTSKKSKTLVHGEYYLITALANAPTSITSLIHPAKLKICNVQTQYRDKGPPVAQQTPNNKPANIVMPPGTTKTTNIEVRTPNPFHYRPYLKAPVAKIAKQPAGITKVKPAQTSVQKRFNGPKVPAWYKIL